jgi:hypothetical protein
MNASGKERISLQAQFRMHLKIVQMCLLAMCLGVVSGCGKQDASTNEHLDATVQKIQLYHLADLREPESVL